MHLPALYHWSPGDRTYDIQSQGLVPSSPPTQATEMQSHICLSPDPATAWELSGALDSDTRDWDLWQVIVDQHDMVMIQPTYGPDITEVRIYNTIEPERVTWIGHRPSKGE